MGSKWSHNDLKIPKKNVHTGLKTEKMIDKRAKKVSESALNMAKMALKWQEMAKLIDKKIVKTPVYADKTSLEKFSLY